MKGKDLTKLGLTEAESKIYYSVLKLGTCSVREISKDSGFHRTNIYDVLEQLKEKGLVTYFKEGQSLKYRVSDPEAFYEIIKEKREFLDSIFPEIKKTYESSSEDIQVEVFKGEEGMKTAFRGMIKEGKNIYAFGVKGQLREKLPNFAEEWQNKVKHNKLKYYGIYTKEWFPRQYQEIRVVSEELSGPVATFIYGDNININIWEPSLVCINIKSKLVAQMYKKHFDLLWKVAERPKK